MFLGREIARTRNHSDETAQLIDSEVRRIIDDAHSRAREIISKNREKLEALAQALLKYEMISGEEVRILLDGGSIDELKAREAAEERARDERARSDDKGLRSDPGWKPSQNPLPGPQQA